MSLNNTCSHILPIAKEKSNNNTAPRRVNFQIRNFIPIHSWIEDKTFHLRINITDRVMAIQIIHRVLSDLTQFEMSKNLKNNVN